MIYFQGTLATGVFEKRNNRFVAQGFIDGRRVVLHVPNTGRMAELLFPGARILCRRADEDRRKTEYDLIAVETARGWMAIDSRLPNLLVRQGIETGFVSYFPKPVAVRNEVPFQTSRFDLELSYRNEKWLIENKCCTLVDGETAMFPDAPTERGRKHIVELAEALKMGYRSAVFFVVQCDYAKFFRSNDEMDPLFGQALREGAHAGIKVFAYNCHVTKMGISLWKQIPVLL